MCVCVNVSLCVCTRVCVCACMSACLCVLLLQPTMSPTWGPSLCLKSLVKYTQMLQADLCWGLSQAECCLPSQGCKGRRWSGEDRMALVLHREMAAGDLDWYLQGTQIYTCVCVCMCVSICVHTHTHIQIYTWFTQHTIHVQVCIHTSAQA